MSQTQETIATRRGLPSDQYEYHTHSFAENLETGLVRGSSSSDSADATTFPETTRSIVPVPDDSLTSPDAILQRIQTLEREMMSLRRADAWTRKNRELHGPPIKADQTAADTCTNRIIFPHNTSRFPHIARSYSIIHTEKPNRIQSIVRIRVPSHLLVNPLAILRRRMVKTEARIQKLLHRLYDKTTPDADERRGAASNRNVRVSYCFSRYTGTSDSDSESDTATETEDCF